MRTAAAASLTTFKPNGPIQAELYLTQVERGERHVPMRISVQMWAVKLDLVLSAFHEKLLADTPHIARHGSVDSSPQYQFNYMGNREDLMIRKYRWAKEFEHLPHQLTLCTLGSNRTGEADKIPMIIYQQKLESGDCFGKRRLQYKTWLADQSTERKTANSSSELLSIEDRQLPDDLHSVVAWP